MSENNIYYYEVFLRSTIKNKEYKISLGSLSGSKFKTVDTEFPTSRFLSSVIGVTTNITSNLDLILEHNKNTYGLSANTLKDLRKLLENGTYRFDADRIDFSESALGDPDNNNAPYTLVKYNNIILQPENLVNEDLTNSNNNQYYSNFTLTATTVYDTIEKLNFYLISSGNPLPTPISSQADISTTKNYLYNFLTQEKVDTTFDNILDINSIQWFNNFWKISSNDNNILSASNNKFTILQESESYEYNKNIKLDGTAKNEDKCSYLVTPDKSGSVEEFIDIITNELLIYINKYSHSINDDGTINTDFNEESGELVISSPGKLKKFLSPKPGSKNWKTQYFPAEIPGVIDIIPVDWDSSTLPEFRFHFRKANPTDLVQEFVPPAEINMNASVKFTIKSTVHFIVKTAHDRMKGTLTNDEDISERINIQKIKSGGYKNIQKKVWDKEKKEWVIRTVPRKINLKGEDYDASENIVKEYDSSGIHISSGQYLDPQHKDAEGTEFPSGTYKISVPVTGNPFTMKLIPKTKIVKDQEVPDVKEIRSARYGMLYSIEYKADAFSLQSRVSKEIDELIFEQGRDGLRESYPDFDPTDDEGFIRSIIEGFRDLLLKKANKKAEEMASVKKECLYLSYDEAIIVYMLFVPPNEVATPPDGIMPGEIDPANPGFNHTRLSVAGDDDALN